jgi:glycyl-tRNA synthetase
VLVTVMRNKQRYFALETPKGELLPHFITVRNGDAEHLDNVTHGNEQVLRARFSDARYFYAQDTTKKLDDFLPRLNTLTFQEKLGSMLDKNQRIGGIVERLGGLFGFSADDRATAKTAARILKADLATQMVIEMTSLQGTMGRDYARLAGYPSAVADAIYDHWLPRGADDGLPSTPAGMLLALADRLDSLVGLFAVGLAPQATADPYGLRRAAMGVIQIMIAGRIDADLAEAVEIVAAEQPVEVSASSKIQVLDFIAGRLKSWLEERGHPFDVSAAVLAAQSRNPARALANIEQLATWVARPDWEAILDGFARCVRITRDDKERYTIDPSAFVQEEERSLYAAYQTADSALDSSGGVDAFLTAFAPMLPAISAFFGTGKNDGVLVNAPDASLRANRHALLQAISAMQHGRADLSQLSGF